jgi:hypothetical protein
MMRANVIGLVLEQTRGVFGWVITILCKVFDEAFVGKEAGLVKAIHAFANFDKDVFVVNK